MGDTLKAHPIGSVEKRDRETVLRVKPEYADGLLGLDGFSHVIVMYWFDRNDSPEDRAVLRVHPRRNTHNPLTGVFACRSPKRPNLIGLEVCAIERVEKDRIIIERIDAFDGSPIVDLKPYIPQSDAVENARVPDWLGRYRDE